MANKTPWILTYNLLFHFPSRSNKIDLHHRGHFMVLTPTFLFFQCSEAVCVLRVRSGNNVCTRAQQVSHIWLCNSMDYSPQSLGLPRQEYWTGLPFPPPGDLPDPRIEPGSPAMQTDSLPLSHQGIPGLEQGTPTSSPRELSLSFITVLQQTHGNGPSGLHLVVWTFSFVPGSRCSETLNSEWPEYTLIRTTVRTVI